MLKIIAHRGFWLEKSKQNSLKAFKKAFENGFGVETDVRDFNGELVISHDIATKNALSLRELLKLHTDFCTPNFTPPLALNIKADGLQSPLKALLKEFKTQNYFAFDMSVPDMLGFEREKIAFYTRQSEIEPKPQHYMKALYEKAEGVWMDEFYSHWISESAILGHLKRGKKLAIVSPELHKREYKAEWKHYKDILQDCHFQGEIALCTDFPHFAKEFFNKGDFQ